MCRSDVRWMRAPMFVSGRTAHRFGIPTSYGRRTPPGKIGNVDVLEVSGDQSPGYVPTFSASPASRARVVRHRGACTSASAARDR
jgi:hypothetical protein